ncbi:ABC transporter ATP-binding protein [Ectobacillus panaciterrae]|uniref:ABC transporter ATP-binding protein n=1 Tax=Ectobacillus panaciterrae TaxID=363872 RepID=UPI00042872CB|nr:ABC transporter ATP-binding protein [Ectobacillus panaciterrae]
MKIELRNVSKSFHKDANTIENLNLTIPDGELVALLGPSGCGKSTTMLMIAGIYKPNDGTILFDDEPVNDLEPKDRNIGMVFQSYALYPHMTVLDNIAFPLKQMRVPKEERYHRTKEAAKRVHLENFLERKPSELSGGQQQRVALARAIVKEPRVLLLDEPLSNLDARLKIEMREEIRRLQKELGITTIMVTHDQEEAMTMADRIAVMKEGEIVQYSTPIDLYQQPQSYFIAQFIGTPPMNFLKGTLLSNGTSCEFKMRETVHALPIAPPFQGEKTVYFGVRPHDISIGCEGDLQLKGKVLLTESLGHASLISAEVEQTYIRFMTSPQLRPEIGAILDLAIKKDALHVFDMKTGERLG